MANKDVKFIISAKNEASAVIATVADALKDLTQAQTGAGQSAKKTDGLLGDLGAEFQSLSRDIAGLNALAKVAGILDKATAAAARLETASEESSANLAAVGTSAEAAKGKTAALTTEAEALAAALVVQKDALKAAKKEQTEANSALEKALGLQDRMAARVAKHKQPVGAFPGMSAAASAQVFIAAEVDAGQIEAARARAAYAALAPEVEKAKNAVADATEKVKAASSAEIALNRELDKATAANNNRKAALAAANGELEKIKGLADGAASALGGVTVSEEQLRVAADRSAEALKRTNDMMAAIQRYSTGGAAYGGFTEPKTAAAMVRTREEMARSVETQKLLQGQIKTLAAEISKVGVPTKEQAEAFKTLTGAARAAKTEAAALEGSLGKLGNTAKGSFAALNKVDGDGLTGLRARHGVSNLKTPSTAPEAKDLGFLAQVLENVRKGWREVYGESRQAMSGLQRVRGEVLSLATAYLGLYNGITQIGNVLTAYQKLEAAQNRLGAVFNQDGAKVRSELSWLERQAARLGIEFGALADQYGKFAVAAQAANFSAANTRKIFLAVAEAGRVNKLSQDNLNGVFLALEQMISKGKVSSEELRRQLGDRMAGAFNIFAEALGLTAAQLDDLMQKGEVLADESTLLKFATELDKRFGGQLADALKTTTTLIGQWSNEVYNAQLRIGQGGFIASFNALLGKMIEYFRSDDGRQFFLSLGAALGTATNFLALFAGNIDTVFMILKGFIALKVAQFIIGLLPPMALTATGLGVMRINLMQTVAAMGSFTGMMATVRAGLTALAGAFMRFLPTMVLTIAAFGAGELLTRWIGGVDSATEALDKHRALMQQVLGSYDKVKGNAREWAAELGKLPIDAINANVRRLRAEMEKSRGKIVDYSSESSLDNLKLNFSKEAGELRKLRTEFKNTVITAAEYEQQLLKVYNATDSEPVRRYIEGLLTLVRAGKEVQISLGEAATAALEAKSGVEGLAEDAKVLGKNADGTVKSVKDLAEAGNDVAKVMGEGKDPTKGFQDALDKLKEKIPELAAEMKKLKELSELNADIFKMGSPTTVAEMRAGMDMAGRARAVILGTDEKTAFAEIAKNTKLTVEGIASIRGSEGYRSEAYRNSPTEPWTIGYGHTGAAGGIQPVPGMKITQAEALQQFGDDLAMFARQVDKLVSVPLTDAMRTALTSIQMNSGGLNASDGRRLILDPLNAGDYAKAQEGITKFRTTGSGQDLSGRRAFEASQFGSQGMSNADIEVARLEALKKTVEENDKLTEATKKRIDDGKFEISQEQMKLAGKEREAFIENKLREARQENKNISAAELEIIRQQAGQQYDLNHSLSEAEQRKKNEKEAAAAVNALETERNALLEMRKTYEAQGNTDKIKETDAALAGVNLKLREAIDNAIKMWQAIGGSEANANIAKLESTKIRLAETSKAVAVTKDQFAELFAGGLTDAAKNFFAAVAKGENAVKALGRAFLQFAANFLMEIAQMILKQTILNMLQSMGMQGGGSALGFMGIKHEGGIAGSGGRSRAVPVAAFANAVRYHTGGLAGFAPDEVPLIARKTEELITEDDPRHRNNGGLIGKLGGLTKGDLASAMGGVGRAESIKNVLLQDPEDVANVMATSTGERVLLTFVKNNRESLKKLLGD